MSESRVASNVCLWDPQESEVRLIPQPEGATITFSPFDGFWYLQVAPSLMIAVGRHPGSVASDAAAMRKLSAVAAEAAGHLERRAAEMAAGGGEAGGG